MKKTVLLFFAVLGFSITTKAQVIINEIYGGGGNNGAAYKNDFIELFNNSTKTVSLTGWSLQYATAKGKTWQATVLSGNIQPGSYYLVQEAGGTRGANVLPPPDLKGSIAMGAVSGKVILCNTSVLQTGDNPGGSPPSNVIDKVGYGASATGFETAPAPVPSNTMSIQRSASHTDTDDNQADFTTGIPMPKNASTSDSTAPLANSFSPPDHASDVATGSPLRIAFNKNVKSTPGAISLHNTATGTSEYIFVQASNPAVIIAGSTITIHGINLQPGSHYYITIPDSVITDLTGNKYAGITDSTTWNFSTGDAVDTPVAGILNKTYTLDSSAAVFNADGFKQYSVSGPVVWEATTFGDTASHGVEMNGFFNGTNQLNEDWFISPPFNLTATSYPLLSFLSANKFNGDPLELKVSTNYPGFGNPDLYTWIDLNGRFPPQAADVWTLSGNINLSAFKSAKTYLAFVYTSSSDDGQRWTLDDIRIDNSSSPPPPGLSFSTRDLQYNYVAPSGALVKTVNITGNDITGDIRLIAPANFSLSADATGFSDTLTLRQEDANNVTRPVYIKFAPNQINKNYFDSVIVNTREVSPSKIYVRGSSIDPANTLEIVNWNLEWFGSPVLGPTDDDLQEKNVKIITQNIAADLYAVVEVVSEPRLRSVVDNLNAVYGAGTYGYVLCDYGSHVNPFETPPPTGTLADAQKEAFIYKKALFSNITTTALLSQGVNTAADLNNPDYNYWSSGRYPFMMTADVTLNGITKNIHFVLLHAKANTAPTVVSYNRRKSGADDLHTYLSTTFPNDNIIMLGDFNDDLDSTITDGIIPRITSYVAFTVDKNNFISPTLSLSLAGTPSTVKYPDIIDHVYLSDNMWPYYLTGTASVLSDQAALIPSYGTTTSDHYPVFSRYAFDPSILPAKLLSFTARKSGSRVHLKWSTSLESATRVFEMERSADCRNWITLGSMNSADGTNGHEYTMVDSAPLKQVNYYRIKQTDSTGKSIYTTTKVVSFSKNNTFTVTPNPAKDSIEVLLTKNSRNPVTIQLLDTSGTIVYKVETNDVSVMIDVQKFSRGSYTIKLTDGAMIKSQHVLLQ